MEKSSSQEHDHAQHALPNEDRRQAATRQFKGIRLREWGKWVSEIRMPKSREKIHLGSYNTAEQAARAFDAGMYCLRGPKAKFNFPNSVPNIPSASSLSPQQIQAAAAKYALDELPGILSTSLSDLHNDSKEEPSQSSSELAFWKSVFEESDGDGVQHLNLEKIPSMDEALALELIPTSQEEELDISVDPLWNFEDI